LIYQVHWYIYNRVSSWVKWVELYRVYVQLIYFTNLFFDSSSAHLVHEPSSRANYQIELQTIHELTRIIVNPNRNVEMKKFWILTWLSFLYTLQAVKKIASTSLNSVWLINGWKMKTQENWEKKLRRSISHKLGVEGVKIPKKKKRTGNLLVHIWNCQAEQVGS
jgi:hypothetical protein